jgi:hypothetical protein
MWDALRLEGHLEGAEEGSLGAETALIVSDDEVEGALELLWVSAGLCGRRISK